eukprot:3045032-Alexandrium_andersonii.AAC.1
MTNRAYTRSQAPVSCLCWPCLGSPLAVLGKSCHGKHTLMHSCLGSPSDERRALSDTRSDSCCPVSEQR